MYDPPACVWAITIAGPTAIAAATCIALYSGAVRAGMGRKRAALLGGAWELGRNLQRPRRAGLSDHDERRLLHALAAA